jgi:hypothetical protein
MNQMALVSRIPHGVFKMKACARLSLIPGMTKKMALLICTYLELESEDDLAIFTEVQDPVKLYEEATSGMIVSPLERYAIMNGLRLAVHHLNKIDWKVGVDEFLVNVPNMEYNTAKFFVLCGITYNDYMSSSLAAIDYYSMFVELCDMSPLEGFLVFENLRLILGARKAVDEFGPPNPFIPGI